MENRGVKGWVAALLLAVATTFAANAAAEKREQTYVKDNFRTTYKSSVMVGGSTNHEVGQEMTITAIKYSGSGFRTVEEFTFNQFDYTDGSGPHRGTYVDAHEDGSHTFGTYEGTQKTVVNSDGSWEAIWEGKYRYTGGTGKFKNIKGGGTYKGKASSKEPAREEGRESVEW